MKRFVLLLAVAGVAACTTVQSGSSTSSESTPKTSAVSEQAAPAQELDDAQAIRDATAEVTFLDLTAFDDDLSSSLSERNRNVVIDVPAKFSLNKIPERVEKWLAAVKESGGKVQAKAAPKEGVATRGLVGALIDITVSAVKAKQEATKLSTAENYNALLTYDKETGEVQDILFYHR